MQFHVPGESKPSAFTRLIHAVGLEKPNFAVFDEDYQGSVAAVAADGEFDFYGLRLAAPGGVYSPTSGGSTNLIASAWHNARLDVVRDTFLELGCGSGALALMAARCGWKVTAGDIDPLAVVTAQANAQRNGLSVDVHQSDLFAAFERQRFDRVVFNLPFYHKATVAQGEIALADTGGALAKRFLDEARGYLNPNGYLVFSYSNCSDGDVLDRDDWAFQVVSCDFDGRGRYWRAVVVAQPR